MTVEKAAARFGKIVKVGTKYRHSVYIFKERKTYSWLQDYPSQSFKDYARNYHAFRRAGEAKVEDTNTRDLADRRGALEARALREVPALRKNDWIKSFSNEDLENEVWRDRRFLSDLGIIEDYYDY